MKLLFWLVVAIVVGGSLWDAGHYVWAVLAFLALASGLVHRVLAACFWLVVSIAWLLIAGTFSPRWRRGLIEFWRAARALGIVEAFSAIELRAAFAMWREANRRTGVPAEYFLETTFGSYPSLRKARREYREALKAAQHAVPEEPVPSPDLAAGAVSVRTTSGHRLTWEPGDPEPVVVYEGTEVPSPPLGHQARTRAIIRARGAVVQGGGEAWF